MTSPELKAQQDRDHAAALESAQGLGADILPRRKTTEEMEVIQAELKVQEDKEFAWANQMNKELAERPKTPEPTPTPKIEVAPVDEIEEEDDWLQEEPKEDTRQAA